MKKSSYIKANKSHRAWLRTLYTSCVIVFAFTLVYNAGANLFNGNKKTKPSFSSLQNSSQENTHRFYQMPIKAKSTELTLENILEAEEDIQIDGLNDFDYQETAQSWHHYNLSLDKTLSALPPLFHRNKNTVPLFVLHHSWKSFLH